MHNNGSSGNNYSVAVVVAGIRVFFAFHYGIFGYTLFRRVCCRFYARICIAFVAVVNAILIMIMEFCWLLRRLPALTPFPLAATATATVTVLFTWLVVGARGVYVMLSFCCGPRPQSGLSRVHCRHLNSYLNYICLYINLPSFCVQFHLQFACFVCPSTCIVCFHFFAASAYISIFISFSELIYLTFF